MLRADFPELHPHNRHRGLLLLNFFVVSLQHKSGARPMASTLLMLKRRAELGSEAMPRFRSYVISTDNFREATNKNLYNTDRSNNNYLSLQPPFTPHQLKSGKVAYISVLRFEMSTTVENFKLRSQGTLAL